MKNKFILKVKDNIIDKINNSSINILKFKLKKTGIVLNDYVKGEVIIVSGRKTSGKSSFILKNYIMDPMEQKYILKKELDLKIMYFSTKKTYTETIEKMSTYYISSLYKEDMIKGKLSVASFYRYPGAIIKLTKELAVTYMSRAISYINNFIKQDYLEIIAGSYTIDEIITIVKDSFSNKGIFNSRETSFEYTDKDESFIPIIVVDDVSLIIGDNGLNCVKGENANRLGMELKKLAKMLSAVIVINVPSSSVSKSFGKKERYYVNSVDEIGPYTYYADKILFMHNPMETEDFHPFGYTLDNFTSKKNGICYFRYLNIAANTLGPSGVVIPYFFFPQSSQMYELPKGTEEQSLKVFYDIVKQKESAITKSIANNNNNNNNNDEKKD